MRQKRYFSKGDRSEKLLHFIKQKICMNGPMSVADFMRLTAVSPIGGYYSRHGSEIFGKEGDFITAPELSQIFGELIAVWCYHELANTGHTGEWQLVESGPGTGQLMLDLTRVLKQLKFSVFICNEFLDALPINQFRKDAEGKWHEVCVALDTNDNLCFMLSKAENLHTLKDAEGKWHEVCVALDTNDNLCFMLSKAENLHTLGLLPKKIRQDQSVKEWEISVDAGVYVNQGHQLVHPLESPGEHDLTADVNFGHLKNIVEDRTLVYGPIEQREFLAQMGIGLRLERLLEGCKTKEERTNLLRSSEILLSEEGMGTRFKFMSMFPKTLKDILEMREGPAGFAASSTL
ncbi:unnamed protein product [Gongylonema pulchrum]|uniref:Protein arginine methyltransferase NDUFAF7 n=1 Tax=Gongylonema pulchrum TaxID=637853 RepID=A0A183E319_9BILA|nr:unnamed protein product [Gongylonema pulchrum]